MKVANAITIVLKMTKTMINIDNIMRNTFAVVTNRCGVEDILELYEGEDAMFYGNPLDMTIEDIDFTLKILKNMRSVNNYFI